MKKFLATLILAVFVLTGAAQAACTQAIPTSFKQEILQGGHESTDTFKIALYTTAAATLGAATTAYTATGEITGTGYVAGGATLSGFSVTADTTTAILDWTTNPSWASSTITADCFMIYNSTATNKAVYVGTFTSTSSTNGTFSIVFPVPAAATGLLRFARIWINFDLFAINSGFHRVVTEKEPQWTPYSLLWEGKYV